jgi:hypothetical protein
VTNAQEKRITKLAAGKGYRLEKIGKGVHHGRLAIVHLAECARMPSGVAGAEYSFSPEEAEAWLVQH